MQFKGTIGYRTGALGAQVHEVFAASFIHAIRHLDRWLEREAQEKKEAVKPIWFSRGRSSVLHESAHQMAGTFLGDWFLMLDTDHVFNSDVFVEMVQTFEGENVLGRPLDVLVGWTQKREPPYTPTAYRYDFHPEHYPERVKLSPIERYTLQRIDSAGAAALMVRRSVIERMKHELHERPFQPRWKYDAGSLGEVFQKIREKSLYDDMPDTSDPFFWEDFSFFWRCKLLGVECYLAPWIVFPHLETRMVVPEMEQSGAPPVPNSSTPPFNLI